MSRGIAQMKLNKAQALVILVMAKIMYLFFGRGTGKTVGGGGPWCLHKVEVMPGSSGAIVGQSFSDLRAKILKPLFAAWQMLGHERDLHYVFGVKPPSNWKKPILPIIDYTNVISFPNGTTIQLVSMHQIGSANSNSFQWVYFPEAKFLKEKQMQEVIPAIRGLVKEFGESPWYGAMLFETDKLHPNIHWLLKQRELHDEKKVQALVHLQLVYNGLRLKLANVSNSHAYKIKQRMKRLELVMNDMRRKIVYVGEARALDNIENLSPDFFASQRKLLTDYEYRIAIDNEDPTKAEDGFYPDRTDRHLYIARDGELINDDNINEPLAIAMDYQASIVPLVSAQVNDNIIGSPSLNILRTFHVKHPKKIKDVVNAFCDFHKERPCKTVYYFYDHTAVGESASTDSYKEEVIKCFKARGWRVIDIYMGQALGHDEKYNFINKVLREEDLDLMPVRFNEQHTLTLLTSMDLTETKDHSGTQKDKSKEKDKNVPQELAPHFSDTFDQLIQGVHAMNLYPKYGGEFIGGNVSIG